MAAAVARRAERALTVLIVEDEEPICELMSEILEESGFDACCVTTDRDAYAALGDVGRYAAVLVDVNLGEGTTGFDVARFARQRNPEIPVMYVSGHATPTSFRTFGVSGSRFLQKPFTPEELLTELMLLVDEDSEAIGDAN